jgi:hypothetical protein
MKVTFNCSTVRITEFKSFYRAAVSAIKEEHTLVRDWIERSIDAIENGKEPIPYSEIYQDVMSTILQTDVAIFDCTVKSMSMGHQLTFALDKNKPTLILVNKSEGPLENLFISGNKSPLLTIKSYTSEAQITSIIKTFLRSHGEHSKTRFNLVLDKSQDMYVRWASKRYNKSKTELIKQSVDTISGSDAEYQSFLVSKE